MNISPLPAIAALVRAGAVERGWELFAEGGHDERTGDPAVLAVKGSLLKARGRLAKGQHNRRRLFAEAAAAYASADALAPASYLAINIATLQLLAGHADAARATARDVLARLDAPEPPADTPYYLAATRAEALLLLDDRPGALAALEAAFGHDPDGWDNHAVTLTQLRTICVTQGAERAWLDRFSPPASLHFAGHMGLAASGAGEAELARTVEHFLQERRVGFAWGALASGADIVIAERLLARGAELHVVLPCPVEQFARQSVEPAGAEWLARFDRCLSAAASLRIASTTATTIHDPIATALAGELAIGGALVNAARLGSAAVQLIICDETGGGTNTARQAAMWRAEMGMQERIAIPREVNVNALFAPEQPDPARQLVTHVAIRIDALSGATALPTARIAELTGLVGEALDGLMSKFVRAAPGLWELAVDDPALVESSIARLLAMARRFGENAPSVGVHLAISAMLEDRPSGSVLAYGGGPEVARQLASLAPPGLALASAPYALAMAVRRSRQLRSELYLTDEPAAGGSAHLLLKDDQ